MLGIISANFPLCSYVQLENFFLSNAKFGNLKIKIIFYIKILLKIIIFFLNIANFQCLNVNKQKL